MKRYAKVKVKKMDFGGGIDYTKYLNQGAGVANTVGSAYSNPNANAQQKADAVYNGAAQTASMISPVVGGLIGIGDAIGAPIKKNAEKMDAQGNLINENGAKTGALIGALANPFKALTTRSTYKGGFSDFSGNGYINSIEKPAQDAYKAEEAQKQADADALAKQKYNDQMNYSKGYNMVNPTTGREGAGIFGEGGDMTGGDNPPVKPVYSTQAQLNYPMYHQRIVDGKSTYWRGQFHGSPDAWKTMNKNPMAYVPNAVPITVDEYNKNLGTGNMMPTYTAPVDPFATAPTVTTPTNVTPVQAYGGRMAVPYSMKATGGNLVPLASDVTKAVGDTHEQDSNGDGMTGITLHNQGQPLAEVENQEVMNGSHVYSDRLKVKPGVTFAKMAETLGRKKGKFEEGTESTNYREKNSANRMTSNIDKDLDILFAKQEQLKQVNGIGNMPVNNIPKGANGLDLMDLPDDPSLAKLKTSQSSQPAVNDFSKVDWAKVGQTALPYLDNLYNASMINKTPEIPNPVKHVAYDLTPATLKTNININPALNDAQRQYASFQKDSNENNSNSVTSRGNKLAAFSSLIGNKSNLYGAKENGETELINKNSMNNQDVTNQNRGNRQTVDNQNIDATNSYNWANMQRTSDMNAMRSKNFSNAINNATTQVQDHNMEKTDNSRIMTDALRYNDGAGFARAVGSPEMDSLIRSNPAYLNQIEKALESSGQVDALNTFRKRYKS